MAKECLLKTYKAASNNPNLPYFDMLDLYVTNRTTSNYAQLAVKRTDSSKTLLKIGSGLTVGLQNSIVGPQDVELDMNNIASPYGAYGTGMIGVNGLGNIEEIFIGRFGIKSNFFDILQEMPSLEKATFNMSTDDAMPSFDISSVAPLTSLVNLSTSQLIVRAGISLRDLAGLYPNMEELYLLEPGLTGAAQFSYFVNLTKITLASVGGGMAKCIEDAVKEYINSGRKTSGTFIFREVSTPVSFNGKTISGSTDYTVTWNSSQINVTDGNTFNETMYL